ncbi:MAG: excinuclease ABC subunit UvrC [Deltaproteobacteria bacterium]|nr:excinuclease ABC subunit UvrC [Deltaproteobacteria bacterium]
MDIQAKLKDLPRSPGVYMMKGTNNEIIYIGKAKDLAVRIGSYFKETGDERYAARFLSSKTADIECIVTANEKEALLLEDTLIKRHKPKYNISLKDSKTYVSIKVTVHERFPRIFITRKITHDGSRYFGPYPSAQAVRETVKFLRGIFPLCVCSDHAWKAMTRPCLDYQMGLCPAPAVGLINEADYRKIVDNAIMFLEGKNRALVKGLRSDMKAAAHLLDFEQAVKIRDRLSAIEHMLEGQSVVTHRPVDRDVFAVEGHEAILAVHALFIRDGRLTGNAGFIFENNAAQCPEALSSFITQFYKHERHIPDEVILPFMLDDMETMAEWLGEQKGRKVSFLAPERGERTRLLALAKENALEGLRKKVSSLSASQDALAALQKRLRLTNNLRRIEAYDISNISGAHTVGAMAVFLDGQPLKDAYRLFKIRGVAGQDDYAHISEMLTRRFKAQDAKERPHLILIDGGKGQLNVALAVLSELGVNGIAVAAIAKDKEGVDLRRKGERVFLPNVKDPVLLKEGSAPDLLLRRIRDEVHRFAISYNRRLRSKAIGSILDSVPGIGARKRKALFDRFGDLETIVGANEEELATVTGITKAMAVAIKSIKRTS